MHTSVRHAAEPTPPRALPRPTYAQEWAARVLACGESVVDETPAAVHAAVVEAAQDSPLYGACCFHVRKKSFPGSWKDFPAHCILAISGDGLRFVTDTDDRSTLAALSFADVHEWEGDVTSFALTIRNTVTEDTENVCVYTSEAAVMAALMLDSINFALAAEGPPPRNGAQVSRARWL